MSDQPGQQNNDPLGNPSEEVGAASGNATSAASGDAANATSGTAESTQAGTGSRDAASELVEELRELGNQMEAAFRAALESERTRQLQRDLMGGLKELTTQVKTALKSAQDDPRLQQASERGREVLRNAQTSKAAQDLQEALVTGVAQLNAQVRKLVDRLESTPSSGGSSTPSQHVPVEHDDASTGPTTRLDESGSTGETTRLDPRD